MTGTHHVMTSATGALSRTSVRPGGPGTTDGETGLSKGPTRGLRPGKANGPGSGDVKLCNASAWQGTTKCDRHREAVRKGPTGALTERTANAMGSKGRRIM